MANKLAVVRVRGGIHVDAPIKTTLDQLHLHNKNWCVIIEENASTKGMLQKVKDYVTWGIITPELEKELFTKKGETYNQPTQDAKKKYTYTKFVTYDKKQYKPYFRLSPPKKGFGRAGIKQPFVKGGALGNRNEHMTDLLQRMM